MKKFLLSILGIAALGFAANAAEVKLDFTNPESLGVEKAKPENGTVVKEFSFEGVKVTITDGEGATDAQKLRFFTSKNDVVDFRTSAKGGKLGHKFTVEYTENITKIVFDGTNLNATAEPGTLSDKTWKGDSKTVTFTTTGAVNLSSMTVYSGETGGNDEEHTFKKVTSVAGGDICAFVAGGKVNELYSKAYGYMSASELPAGATATEFATTDATIGMTFEAVAGGFNIKTAEGKYLGAKADYNTFDTTDDSKDNRVWTVAFNDGKATITNVVTGKVIYQDPNYGSFGAYSPADAAEYNLPELFKLDGGAVLPTPEVKEYATIADFVKAADTFNQAKLTCALTAVYQNGRYLYVTDGASNLLIYGDVKQKYNNGDAIPAGVTGKYQLYNGVAQLSNPEADTFQAGTAGTAVAPKDLTVAEITAAMAATYVAIDKVTIAPQMDGDAAKENYYEVTDETGTITLFNQFADAEKYDAVTVETGTNKKLLAIVSCYKEKVQLFPVKVLEAGTGVENIAADANAPVEYYNLQGVRVANPENGLYIRRQGNTVTKVLVK